MIDSKYDVQVWSTDMVIHLRYEHRGTKTTIRIDMDRIGGLPGFSHGPDFTLPIGREKIVEIARCATQVGLNKEDAIASVWEILCILKAWHQLWRELGQQILLSENALDEIERTRREFFPELLWEGPIDPYLLVDFRIISQGDEEKLADMIYSYRRNPDTQEMFFDPTEQYLQTPVEDHPRPREVKPS